jgi:MFS family permease
MALFAVALCVLVPLSALVLVLLLLGVSGAASVHVEAAATELLQSDVPDRVRAHVLGVTDALMVGAAMIGSFVGPVLVEAVGGSASLAVLAIVTVVAGALVLPVVRHSATLRGSSAVEAD